MEITAVMLARVVAFIEVQELNPRGKAYYPDIAAALVNKFGFQIHPTKPEDFDENKGVRFAEGKFADGTIDQMQIFTHGLILDTRISTDVSEKLLYETLQWTKSELGLHFDDGMIKRKGYGSQLTFESEMSLSRLNPAVGNIPTSSSKLSEAMGQTIVYEPTALLFNLDQSVSKLTPGVFSIERRAEVPFSDKKYFSMPAGTTTHRTLTTFENHLLSRPTESESRSTLSNAVTLDPEDVSLILSLCFQRERVNNAMANKGEPRTMLHDEAVNEHRCHGCDLAARKLAQYDGGKRCLHDLAAISDGEVGREICGRLMVDGRTDSGESKSSTTRA
jgi:hypothetical protein